MPLRNDMNFSIQAKLGVGAGTCLGWGQGPALANMLLCDVFPIWPLGFQLEEELGQDSPFRHLPPLYPPLFLCRPRLLVHR